MGNGYEPTQGDEMENRVAQQERTSREIREKLIHVEARMDSIESNIATKDDLANLASKDDLNRFVLAPGKDIQGLAVSLQKDIQSLGMACQRDIQALAVSTQRDIQALAVSCQKAINDQTWKFISVAAVLAGLAFTAAKFIH